MRCRHHHRHRHNHHRIIIIAIIATRVYTGISPALFVRNLIAGTLAVQRWLRSYICARMNACTCRRPACVARGDRPLWLYIYRLSLITGHRLRRSIGKWAIQQLVRDGFARRNVVIRPPPQGRASARDGAARV